MRVIIHFLTKSRLQIIGAIFFFIASFLPATFTDWIPFWQTSAILLFLASFFARTTADVPHQTYFFFSHPSLWEVLFALLMFIYGASGLFLALMPFALTFLNGLSLILSLFVLIASAKATQVSWQQFRKRKKLRELLAEAEAEAKAANQHKPKNQK